MVRYYRNRKQRNHSLIIFTGYLILLVCSLWMNRDGRYPAWYTCISYIPFGVYMSLFLRRKTLVHTVLAGTCMGIAVEGMQYVFRTGTVSGMDIMMSTAGTAAGIAVFAGMGYLFREYRTSIINNASAAVLSGIFAVMAYMSIASYII